MILSLILSFIQDFMTPKITSKLPKVETTIFTEMSLLATKENAVNLSQGFPDFPTDDRLVSYLGEASKSGYNQYSPLSGVLKLREEIAKKIENSHQAIYNVDDEITVTAGATQAIFTAIAAIISKGDEVIIVEPAYDCYEPTIELFGGITKRLTLHYPDYQINWNEMKALVTDKTKMIILNNPNNPSGKIFTQRDITELIDLVKDTNIILLSDEVYENVTFDGNQHLSFARFPELKERSYIVASFGKLFHITGWKIGYVVAPKELMQEFRKVHQYNVFCVNAPAQSALANYMSEQNDYSEIAQFFQQKRDYFRKGLEQTPFEVLDCEATYFLSVNFNTISELNDKAFCYYLTQNYKVASIPFSAFYHNFTDEKVIRFCFAKKQDTLDAAIENFLKIKI